MKNKELYIEPELELVNYSFNDIIHTSTIDAPAVTDEAEIDIDDLFGIEADGDIVYYGD